MASPIVRDTSVQYQQLLLRAMKQLGCVEKPTPKVKEVISALPEPSSGVLDDLGTEYNPDAGLQTLLQLRAFLRPEVDHGTDTQRAERKRIDRLVDVIVEWCEENDITGIAATRDELRAPIHFDTRIFFKELFAHTFLPLSIPFILFFEGWKGLSNRELLDFSQMSIFAYMTSSMVAFLIVAFILLRDSDEFIGMDVMLAIGTVTFRNVSIAYKHAYRSAFHIRLKRLGLFFARFRRAEEIIYSLLPNSITAIRTDATETAYRLQIPNPLHPVIIRFQHNQAGRLAAKALDEIEERRLYNNPSPSSRRLASSGEDEGSGEGAGVREAEAVVGSVAKEEEVAHHPLLLAVAFKNEHSLKLGKVVEKVAFIPETIPPTTSRPPIPAGTYAKTTIAAILAHYNRLDSFDIHSKSTDGSIILDERFITAIRFFSSCIVTFTPAIGRAIEGKNAFGSGRTLPSITLAVALVLLMMVWFLFTSPFLVGILLHPIRLLWTLKRYDDMIDKPDESGDKLCSGWLKEMSETTEDTLGIVAQSTELPPQTPEALVSEEDAAERVHKHIERFNKSFTVDFRFASNVTGMELLRRWLPMRSERMLRRVEFVYVVILLFVLILGIFALRGSVDPSHALSLAILLPAAVIAIHGFISLTLFLVVASRFNEYLNSHTQLIHKQSIAIAREWEEWGGGVEKEEGDERGEEEEEEEEEGVAVMKKLASSWETTSAAIDSFGEICSSESSNPHIGPKIRFLNIAIDRNVVRLVLSSAATALVLVLQQTASIASDPLTQAALSQAS